MKNSEICRAVMPLIKPVVMGSDKLEQGYTSRIIFLELAALLWEEEGN